MALSFVFGLVGFILGAGLVYFLQNRKLESVKRRLEQKKTALEQSETLNRQQNAKLQKLHQSQLHLQELEQTHAAQIQQLQGEHQAELQRTKQSLETAYQTKTAELEQAAVSHKWQNDSEEQPPVLPEITDSQRPEATGQTPETWADSPTNKEITLLDVLLEEGEEESTLSSPVNGFSPESAAQSVNPWEKTIASDGDTSFSFPWPRETEAGREEDSQIPLSNPFLAEKGGQDPEKASFPLDFELAELFAKSEEATEEELDFLAMLNLEGEEAIDSAEASANGHPNGFQELLATDPDREPPEKNRANSPFSAN